MEATKSYNPALGITFAGYVKSRVKYSVWNALKKQYRQRLYETSIDDSGNREQTRLIDTLPDKINISDIIDRLFLVEILEGAMNRLPDRQRLVIFKSIILNYKQTEIAAELGIAPQAVFKLRKRALIRLQAMLKKSIND